MSKTVATVQSLIEELERTASKWDRKNATIPAAHVAQRYAMGALENAVYLLPQWQPDHPISSNHFIHHLIRLERDLSKLLPLPADLERQWPRTPTGAAFGYIHGKSAFHAICDFAGFVLSRACPNSLRAMTGWAVWPDPSAELLEARDTWLRETTQWQATPRNWEPGQIHLEMKRLESQLESEVEAIPVASASHSTIVSLERPGKPALTMKTLDKAIGVLAGNPGWSVQRIADEVGVARGTLYRHPKFVYARQAMKDEGKRQRVERQRRSQGLE